MTHRDAEDGQEAVAILARLLIEHAEDTLRRPKIQKSHSTPKHTKDRAERELSSPAALQAMRQDTRDRDWIGEEV